MVNSNAQNSIKDIIIKILCKKWPITARKTFFIINKTSGRSITYQAVHKAMKELLYQKVVEKTEDGYKLDMQWISDMRNFAEHLHANYRDEAERNDCLIDFSINAIPVNIKSTAVLYRPISLKNAISVK